MIRNGRTHGRLIKANVVGGYNPFRIRDEKSDVNLEDCDGYELEDSEGYELLLK